MKKLIVVILSMFLILSLMSCGKEASVIFETAHGKLIVSQGNDFSKYHSGKYFQVEAETGAIERFYYSERFGLHLEEYYMMAIGSDKFMKFNPYHIVVFEKAERRFNYILRLIAGEL